MDFFVPHLIAPVHDKSLQDCPEQLREAHACLVTGAIEMLAAVRKTEPRYWGSDFKRSQVTLPPSRPVILQQGSHNFGEIVNQVAGLERLLDGLEWFAAERPAAHVQSCHPSTSSAVGENDVILSDSGELFRVEVFDIAGAKITNDKLNKTLRTFGLATGWVPGHLLLFVSKSVAPRILPRLPNERYYFSLLWEGEWTHILELHHR